MSLNIHISRSSLKAFVFVMMLTLALMPATAKARKNAEASPSHAQDVQGTLTLTVEIDGLRNSVGNIDMLVFDQTEGWPDEIPHAIRAVEVPAVEGTMLLKVAGLPPGDYAVIVVHDENFNRRIDKDWRGVPIEQWGMSNNPRVYLSTPAFHRARFHMESDLDIHVTMKLYP